MAGLGTTPSSRIALLSAVPASRALPDSAIAAIRQGIADRDRELTGDRRRNPGMKVWKRFNTPRFGAGRNVRFGDLDGDGEIDMLIAQNIPSITKKRRASFPWLIAAVSATARTVERMTRPS